MFESNIYHSVSYLWEPERKKKQTPKMLQLVMQINSTATGILMGLNAFEEGGLNS